ncbi:MAG: hypothetical protein COC24_019320 [Alphaproteobacteria bacterium]|nr:hypothetical protein [Alphaproteobacteria bacterium]
MKTQNYDEYMAEGKTLFGEDIKKWKFICPSCGLSQSAEDFKAHDIDGETIDHQIGFSCIGRSVPDLGCNWTLGGLFSIHTLEVVKDGHTHMRFEFDKTDNNGVA